MPKPRALIASLVVATVLSSCSLATQEDVASSTTAPTGSGAPGTDAPVRDFSSAPLRGITDDTITLGAAVIDTERIRDEYGVDISAAPSGVLQSLVTAQNKRGGINGRQIELVERNFLPIGNEESEAVCRELIEDNEVFAVVGTYLADNALCVTEANATTYFSFFGLTQERMDRSKAPYLTSAPMVDEELQMGIDRLIESDELADAKVAVYYENDLDESWVASNVIDRLGEGGIDVVSSAQLPDSGDQVQADADATRILQRFEADGADAVINLGGVAVLLPALGKLTYRPRMVFTNGQVMGENILTKNQIADPESFEDSIAVLTNPTSDEVARDPRFQDCLDDINASTDLDLVVDDVFSKRIKPESREYGLLPSVCTLWGFVLDVLEAAGDDPTPQSILEGLDGIELDYPLSDGASMSPTRWGAGAPPRMWAYDVATDSFEPAGGTAGTAGG